VNPGASAAVPSSAKVKTNDRSNSKANILIEPPQNL
jgi:hypothetical protein